MGAIGMKSTKELVKYVCTSMLLFPESWEVDMDCATFKNTDNTIANPPSITVGRITGNLRIQFHVVPLGFFERNKLKKAVNMLYIRQKTNSKNTQLDILYSALNKDFANLESTYVSGT